jgi:hypothetical protein
MGNVWNHKCKYFSLVVRCGSEFGCDILFRKSPPTLEELCLGYIVLTPLFNSARQKPPEFNLMLYKSIIARGRREIRSPNKVGGIILALRRSEGRRTQAQILMLHYSVL